MPSTAMWFTIIMRETLEWIMKNIDRQKAEEFMQELEQKYPKK